MILDLILLSVFPAGDELRAVERGWRLECVALSLLCMVDVLSLQPARSEAGLPDKSTLARLRSTHEFPVARLCPWETHMLILTCSKSQLSCWIACFDPLLALWTSG